MTPIQLGDRVMFSTRFVQSINAHDLAHLRGEVTEIVGDGVKCPRRLMVDWHDGYGPTRVIECNISLVADGIVVVK